MVVQVSRSCSGAHQWSMQDQMESNGRSTEILRESGLLPARFLMKKLLIYALLVVLAVLVAGFYGIIHNQISYTVSPEYFTKFKFRQFGFVDTQLPERVRASMVGFLASWWMGIPIGLLVGAAGFMHRGPRRMFKM